MLYLASWSRSPDPIGRIWRILCLAVFAAQLQWQERRLGKTMRSGIIFNKVVFPIFWRLRVPVLCRSSGRSPTTSFVKPSRWWCGPGGDSSEVFFNKRRHLLL
jgi:hypothetical protein